jgi:hypothetical protein
MNTRLSLLLLSAALASACSQNSTHVIASTATVIGVDLGQGQGTPTVTGTLGYKRAEFAIVPTDKRTPVAGGGASADSGGIDGGGSAKNAASVIMELNYKGIFSSGGGIYQRLAVGDAAVIQSPAAALLFAKDADGTLDPQAATRITQAATSNMKVEGDRIKVIAGCFDNNGAVDPGKRDTTIAAATGKDPAQFDPSVVNAMKRRSTTPELARFLGDLGSGMVPALFDSLPDGCK